MNDAEKIITAAKMVAADHADLSESTSMSLPIGLVGLLNAVQQDAEAAIVMWSFRMLDEMLIESGMERPELIAAMKEGSEVRLLTLWIACYGDTQ